MHWKGLNSRTTTVTDKLKLELDTQHTMFGDPTGAVAQATVVAANGCMPGTIGQEVGAQLNSRDSMILGAAGHHHTNRDNISGTKRITNMCCPQCGEQKQLQINNICHRKRWAMLTCKHCGHKHTANKCLCPCYLRWHTCKHHQAHYQHLRHNTNSTGTTTAAYSTTTTVQRTTQRRPTAPATLQPPSTKRRCVLGFGRLAKIHKRM